MPSGLPAVLYPGAVMPQPCASWSALLEAALVLLALMASMAEPAAAVDPHFNWTDCANGSAGVFRLQQFALLPGATLSCACSARCFSTDAAAIASDFFCAWR